VCHVFSLPYSFFQKKKVKKEKTLFFSTVCEQCFLLLLEFFFFFNDLLVQGMQVELWFGFKVSSRKYLVLHPVLTVLFELVDSTNELLQICGP